MAKIGRFEIGDELGRGAMGIIYRADHPGLGVPIAIKLLTDELSNDRNFRQRFQQEAAAVAALNHPGIVRVYDFDEDQGHLFIVMELVEGKNLREILQEKGRLPLSASLDLIQQLLSAVGVAHQRGIVHRDLKPENVLISPQGKTKILDFGVSKFLSDDSKPANPAQAVVGTPTYMSPEQIRGRNVDSRSDIYALGIMLYEFLAGTPPFVGSSLMEILQAHLQGPVPASEFIPATISTIINQALAKDATARFASCEEFAGNLLQAQANLEKSNSTQKGSSSSGGGGGILGLGRITSVFGRGEKSATGTCMHAGCTNTKGWKCAYVDQQGQQCQSWWCRDHIEFIQKRPYCRRHTNVMRTLLATSGTLREVRVKPAVDDRSFPLLCLIADDIDKEVTELLRRRYQFRSDVKVSGDGQVQEIAPNVNERGWERVWAAIKPSYGPVLKVVLRVYFSRPDTLQVVVGSQLALEAVPDWIQRHYETGKADVADRVRFRNKVVAAIQEAVDKPASTTSSSPSTATSGGTSDSSTSSNGLQSSVAPSTVLLKGLLLRSLVEGEQVTGYEIAQFLGLPFEAVAAGLNWLVQERLVDTKGLSTLPGPWVKQPLPQRMIYQISPEGKIKEIEITRISTSYVGPAPVRTDEYLDKIALPSQAIIPGRGAEVLSSLDFPVDLIEILSAAVTPGVSILLSGDSGNGKTLLASQLARLLAGPIWIPVALDLGNQVMTVFDPSIHQLDGEQPADRRWRLCRPPLVRAGTELDPEMLNPVFDSNKRIYDAPLQIKANRGVLLIDDLGRQKVGAGTILDRLLDPLAHGVDIFRLPGSGSRLEVPFRCVVVFSSHLSPEALADPSSVARLTYKIALEDPDWRSFARIFEKECNRLDLPVVPQAATYLRALYGDRQAHRNHPRLILETLIETARYKGQAPVINQTTVHAAYNSLFSSSSQRYQQE